MRMPMTAELVDRFRKAFGDGVKVIYASENGFEVGYERE